MRWLALAVVGATVCTVGDHLHATHGVLVYREVFAWDQAWWVPLLFAAASLVCVLAAAPFVAWGRGAGTARPPDARRVAADSLGFCAAYAYTSFAPHDRPNVTLLVLAIAFLVRVIGEARPAWIVAYAILLGGGGVLTEFTVSSTGGFHYLHPDVLATPRWLAGIYLHAGLLTGGLATLLLPPKGSPA